MDTKLKSSRKYGIVYILILLIACSVGMMFTYPSLEKQMNEQSDIDEMTAETVAGMGLKLGEGNYIVYNEVSLETPLSEVLGDFGNTDFDLLRKYMDCGVFDADGDSLLESTSESAASRLENDSGGYYAVRMLFEFASDGELSKVQVTGDGLSPEEEYSAEQSYLYNAESASDAMVSEISNPHDVTIIYGMTAENLEAYCRVENSFWDNTAYLLIDYTDFQFYGLVFSAAAAAGALLIPCIGGVRKPEGRIFRVPFEAVICLIMFMPVPLTGIGFLVYHTMQGTLWNHILGGLPTMALNFMLWFAFFAAVYWEAACLREIFTMKGAYWKERTLTARVLGWIGKRGDRFGSKMKRGAGKIKTFFEKQYDALLHIDFQNQVNRTLLKVVIINFVILVIVCFFWYYGTFALIIYSVLLFFLLRKYTSDLQTKYAVLLQSTNQLADGHLDVPIEGDVGVFSPIQEELKKIQKGFRKAVDEEVKNERMKTELVTNVSHDLRTPLTAIITYTDLLKNEKDEEKRKEYIDVLERKSLRLKVLIEDLFEISKATSKSTVMHYMKVDIVNLIKEVGLENDSKIKDANLEFRWKLPEYKLVMWLDSQKTYRIFENLIVNITKYAMPHTRVYIEMEDLENSVRISMKNVSAAELDFNADEITDRFVRGDSSRNTEGSGLGLAIAKSFAELQHGTLGISTEADLFKVDVTLPKRGDGEMSSGNI